jgi:2-desacetyl-2-hydroxyethyl bacteriochlorophyllide A dehydrogenase
MKAAILTGVKNIVVTEKPKPEPGPGHVLVRVEYCAICGSDVHGYSEGTTVQPGTVMGHECSGTVATVGNDVKDVQVGDRVWVKPAAHCNECYWCKKGKFNQCPNAFATCIGLTPNSDGAFAEYLLVKYPDQMLFKLPPELSFEEAALIEPLIVSRHGIRVSRFGLGATAVVIGAGPIGLGVIQFLEIGGARKIIALEVSAPRARIAAEKGADEVLNTVLEREHLKSAILDLTDGVGPDIVFECSGAASALHDALYYVASGGQIVVIGLHQKEIPFDFWTLLHRKVEVRGSLGCEDDDVYDVINALRTKKIKTESLITDIISLSDIDEKGFKRLLSSEDMVKILVRP